MIQKQQHFQQLETVVNQNRETGLVCGYADTKIKKPLDYQWSTSLDLMNLNQAALSLEQKAKKDGSYSSDSWTRLGGYIRCGIADKIIIIDYDGKHVSEYATREEIKNQLTELLGEPTVRTPNAGYHWYCVIPEDSTVELPAEYRKRVYGQSECIEVRGDGCIAIIPPSMVVTETGLTAYTWAGGKVIPITPEIWNTITAEIPARFPLALSNGGGNPTSMPVYEIQNYLSAGKIDSHRNNVTFWLIKNMKWAGATYDEAKQAYETEIAPAFSKPRDCGKVVDDVYNSEKYKVINGMRHAAIDSVTSRGMKLQDGSWIAYDPQNPDWCNLNKALAAETVKGFASNSPMEIRAQEIAKNKADEDEKWEAEYQWIEKFCGKYRFGRDDSFNVFAFDHSDRYRLDEYKGQGKSPRFYHVVLAAYVNHAGGNVTIPGEVHKFLQNYLNQRYREALETEMVFAPQSYYDSDTNTLWLKFSDCFGCVSNNGFRFVSALPSNLFLDGEPLAKPNENEKNLTLDALLNRFVDTWHITKYDAVKALTWMVTALFTSKQNKVCVITGDTGAGKSHTASQIEYIFDGKMSDEPNMFPAKATDADVVLRDISKTCICVLDNYEPSTRRPEFEDFFINVVNKSGNSKRKLYSDSDQVKGKLYRSLLITSQTTAFRMDVRQERMVVVYQNEAEKKKPLFMLIREFVEPFRNEITKHFISIAATAIKAIDDKSADEIVGRLFFFELMYTAICRQSGFAVTETAQAKEKEHELADAGISNYVFDILVDTLCATSSLQINKNRAEVKSECFGILQSQFSKYHGLKDTPKTIDNMEAKFKEALVMLRKVGCDIRRARTASSKNIYIDASRSPAIKAVKLDRDNSHNSTDKEVRNADSK